MRVGIFMFIWLYCVWQIRTSESQVSAMTKATKEMVKEKKEKEEHGRKEDEKNGSSRREEEFLYSPPLVSPYGGTMKLLMGIAVPIVMSGGRVLVFGQNFQFQYAMPQNATFFTNYFNDFESRARRKRMTEKTRLHRRRNVITRPDNTRSMFYRSLELEFDRRGENGRDCVMRSICEAAETPLKDEGLVGELLHVMLTPDYGVGRSFNTFDDDDDDYQRAAKAGRTGDDCSLIYPSCPEGRGLLDRISRFENI